MAAFFITSDRSRAIYFGTVVLLLRPSDPLCLFNIRRDRSDCSEFRRRFQRESCYAGVFKCSAPT